MTFLPLIYLASLVPFLVKVSAVCLPEQASLSQKRDDTSSNNYELAVKLCEGVINCEVYYDKEWEQYIPRSIPGMEPGSAWYVKNVAPHDPYFNGQVNLTSHEFDPRKLDVIDESDELTERALSIRETSTTLISTAPASSPNLYFNLVRSKQNTHYGNIASKDFIGNAYHLCDNNGCGIGGKTFTHSNVQFVGPAADNGKKVYTGNLVLKVQGNFPGPPGSSAVKDHFIQAIQYTASQTGVFAAEVPWMYCIDTSPEFPSCYSGKLANQHRSGNAFQIHHYVRIPATGLYASGGYLLATVQLQVTPTDSICSELLSILGLVTGALPGVGGISAAFFGIFGLFTC